MQTVVNLYPSAAVAGDRAGLEPIVTTPINYTAEDSAIKVGNFVFAGSDDGLAASTGSTVLGFVVRDLNNAIFDLTAEGTLAIPQYNTVTVATEGDFWAETVDAATVGQKAFASTSDGSITAGDAGGAVDGYTETNFVFKTAADAGELAIIGTWGVR